MTKKWILGGLGVALLGTTLAGCGSNETPDTTVATAPGTTTSEPAAGGDNHDAEIEAALGKFFPGATLASKPFPFSDDAAAHLGEDAGVKFSGKEGKWQVYEATQDGQRAGMGVMTHSALPDGKDMHIAFGVNPKFAISGVTALDAPDNAKMQKVLQQFEGKTLSSSFQVGEGVKNVDGLAPEVAQITADAIKKGLAILDSNFNAAHGESEGAGNGHTEGDGHGH